MIKFLYKNIIFKAVKNSFNAFLTTFKIDYI
jgi:hypothetical protein